MIIIFSILISIQITFWFGDEKYNSRESSQIKENLNKIESNNKILENSSDNIQSLNNLKGIGIFIINETTTSIIKVIKSEINKKKYASKVENITKVKNNISTVFIKYGILNTPDYFCPYHEVWYISSFYLGEIQLRNIRLFFYMDKLYQLECDYNSEVVKGLEYKYGEGKTEHETQVDILTSELKKIHDKYVWENSKVKIIAFDSYVKMGSAKTNDNLKDFYENFIKINSKTFNYKELEVCEDKYMKEFVENYKKKKFDGI